MSHPYDLRPNAKGRVQRRLNAHVAAFGSRNRDKIVAVPSKTGQGVHLYFDPERSLSPDPDQPASHQHADSTEGVIAIGNKSDDSGDSSSGLESDLDTITPDTPSPNGSFFPSSQLRAPKASRLANPEHWQERSTASSTSVHDSMAPIAERRQQALNATQLEDDVPGRRRFLEQRRRAGEDLQRQKMLLRQGGENNEERFAELRREYEGRVEQFRQEYPDIFSFADYSSPPGSPLFTEVGGDDFPDFTRPSSPPSAGPSHLGPGMQEGSPQQRRVLRRQSARELIAPTSQQGRNKAAESEAGDDQFVVVAMRVRKLGPCGTVVIDHETDEEMLVTKRYKVRAEELRSIDEDGDSVMGSDE
jgi:hypothetical protein